MKQLAAHVSDQSRELARVLQQLAPRVRFNDSSGEGAEQGLQVARPPLVVRLVRHRTPSCWGGLASLPGGGMALGGRMTKPGGPAKPTPPSERQATGLFSFKGNQPEWKLSAVGFQQLASQLLRHAVAHRLP